jgi:hypothetical protein
MMRLLTQQHGATDNTCAQSCVHYWVKRLISGAHKNAAARPTRHIAPTFVAVWVCL